MKGEMIVTGWCAYNECESVPPIDEISFEKSESLVRKRWKGQKIAKCKVIIDIIND